MFDTRAIFISYRRGDTEGHAGRLYDDLVKYFGKDKVFMDVAGIEPGRDFRHVIDEQVTSCGVLLAIIGKDWINAKDGNGQLRLDNPSDFVRLETATALKRDIPVIPVLVHGAAMPLVEQLPADLTDLCYRNAVELTHARWDSDVEILANALRPYISKNEDSATLISPPVDNNVGKTLTSEKLAVSGQTKLRVVEPIRITGFSRNSWLLISLLPVVAIGAYLFKFYTTTTTPPAELSKSDVTVQFFSRNRDLPFESIKENLKDFNIIESRKYFDEKTKINALWFGSKVPLSYVKEIAKTLDSTGFQIQGIQPFCTKADDPKLSSTVQIVHDDDYAKYPVITSEKINKSNNFDNKLCLP
jgi:hypothetical protein